MPTRMLRFCRKCLVTRTTLTGEICRSCDSELVPFLDEHGAISREFLAARGNCCGSGCRNCPYPAPESPEGRPGHAACGATQKSCQRCGASFECRSENCWCNDIPLGPATLKWLERSYVGCLCPACLSEFATAGGEKVEG